MDASHKLLLHAGKSSLGSSNVNKTHSKSEAGVMQTSKSFQCPKPTISLSRRLEEPSDTLDVRACWAGQQPRHDEGKSGTSLARDGDVLDGVHGWHIVTVMSTLQQQWVYDG